MSQLITPEMGRSMSRLCTGGVNNWPLIQTFHFLASNPPQKLLIASVFPLEFKGKLRVVDLAARTLGNNIRADFSNV